MMLLQRHGLREGGSIIGHVWPRCACAVEQSSETGGVTELWVRTKMSNDSGLKLLHSTILRKARNTRNLL